MPTGPSRMRLARSAARARRRVEPLDVVHRQYERGFRSHPAERLEQAQLDALPIRRVAVRVLEQQGDLDCVPLARGQSGERIRVGRSRSPSAA